MIVYEPDVKFFHVYETFDLLLVIILNLSVTISLIKISCWPLKRGKKSIQIIYLRQKKGGCGRLYHSLLTNKSGLWKVTA